MDSEIMNVRAKPLSLKDYLLDHMSSCSSNGFRSFPRRQCCTTVRYLLDIEPNNQQHQQYSHFKKNPPDLPRSPARSALLAFQFVVTALKRLPFVTGSLSEAEKPILARSISKKITKKSITSWRRKPNDKKIGRLKSFDELLKEDPPAILLLRRCRRHAPAVIRNSRRWFRWGSDVVEVDKKATNGETMGVPQCDVWVGSTTSNTDGSGITITNSKEKLRPNEDKEQLSPVSVLDCLFDDEDDEVSSPFQHGVAHLEGTKKKLMKKIQRFESLLELEPLNSTERFVLQTESDSESPGWPQQCPCEYNDDKFISEIEQKEDQDENDDNKALKLLHEFKHNHTSYGPKVKVDNLVLDFFRERITNERGKQCESSFDEELVEELKLGSMDKTSMSHFLDWR